MKTYRIAWVLTLGTLFLAGNAWSQPNATVTTTTVRIGGQFQNGGFVRFETKQLSDYSYSIVASGDAYLTQEQVLAGWIWMADRLAAGRPYEMETRTKPHRYEGFTPTLGTPGSLLVGTTVTGKMILKRDGQAAPVPKHAPQ